jgi:WD40 repeat protein
MPIPIAKIERTTAVDFEKEILPILKNNCLACHNQTRAKAELVLETPQSILKGSENGPAIVPGHGEESLLLRLAAHQARPIMPPRDNKVAASNLTPEQLGLLKLWIDLGATGEVRQASIIAWQPVPQSFEPIYAVAVSGDGQMVACNRGNRIAVYNLISGKLAGTLVDPQLNQQAGTGESGIAQRELVHALAFSPRGTLLASAGYREVKLWRQPKDVRRFQIGGASSETTALALSANGAWMASGFADGHIEIREVALRGASNVLAGQSQEIRHLAFSPDGTRLVVATVGQTLSMWELGSHRLLAERNVEVNVTSLRWLPDAKRVVTGCEDGSLRVWLAPFRTNNVIALQDQLTEAGRVVDMDAVDSLPEQLLTGSADGTLRLWDLENHKVLHAMQHKAGITHVALRPDGKVAASVGADSTANLWRITDAKLLATLKGDRYAQESVARAVRALHLATNETTVCQAASVAADKEHHAQVERVRKATDAINAAERALAEVGKKRDEAISSRTSAAQDVANLKSALQKAQATADTASRDTQKIRRTLDGLVASLASAADEVVNGAEDEAISNGEIVAAILTQALVEKARAHGEAQAALQRTTDDFKVKEKPATEKLGAAEKRVRETEAELKKAEQTKSNSENELTLAIAAAEKASEAAKEAQDAVPLAETEAHRLEAALASARQASLESEQPLQAIAFSPNSDALATAGNDQLVHTWNAETGKALETFHGHRAPGRALAFQTERCVVSVSSDGIAIGWDLQPKWALERVIGTGDATSPISDRVNALAFSPDGKALALGSGEPSRSGQIQLWEVNTGRLIRQFDEVHSDAVLALEFSPGGEYLACGAADRFMKVIELTSGRVVKAFEGHTHQVLGLAWKPDGRALASAGGDSVIKLWDFRAGTRKKNVEGFAKEVTSICCLAEDRWLASSGDGQVRLFNDKGEEVRSFKSANCFMYSAAGTVNGDLVVAGGEDSVLRVWNGTTGELVASFEPTARP